MWRYRDWVIRAFNQDLPYDRFLVEQLAGDELVDWRSAEEYTPEILDKLVATGYLRSVFDRTDQDVVNLVGERYDVLFHLMEKVPTGLMGLTVGCARCHSHKYDPIPQRDYYRMLSVFATGYNPVRWLQPKNHHLPSVSKPEQEAIERHNAEIDKPVAKLKERLEAVYRPYRDGPAGRQAQGTAGKHPPGDERGPGHARRQAGRSAEVPGLQIRGTAGRHPGGSGQSPERGAPRDPQKAD